MKIDFQNALLRARTPASFSGTGDIYAEGQRGAVTSLVLSSSAGSSSAVIRTGGSGGTIIANIHVTANRSQSIAYPFGLWFVDGLHVTLTGTCTLDVVGFSETAPA